jgi:putative lipoic acid-binding regulatory protein
MFDLSSHKPIIVYPCRWTFAVLGQDDEDLRAAIATVLLPREYDVTFSKESPKAKYRSLHVHTVVQSEEDRDAVFHGLRQHPAVKMVL